MLIGGKEIAMTPVAFGPLALLVALALGGGIGVPLGIPPQKEDPLLARVAPEECLFYLSSAGIAEADAKSSNQTEQLLAEPEIKALLGQVESAIDKGIQTAAARQRPEKAVQVRLAARAVKALLTRPAALFVASAAMGPKGPDSRAGVVVDRGDASDVVVARTTMPHIDLRGGMVVNLGDDAEDWKKTIEAQQKQLPAGSAQPVSIGASVFYRLSLGPGAPPVTWGIRGKYLIAGIGPRSVEEILDRARGAQPKWLTAIRQQIAVDRVATVSYLDVQALVRTFGPLAGPQMPAILKATGLDGVTTLASVTGLDQEGFVSRTFVGLAGEPRGIFTLASGKPLSAADLAPIPADATLALAARLDLDRAWQTFIDSYGQADPAGAARISQAAGQVEEGLNLKLRDDLLKPLGDVWCLYNSPGEGGLVLTGLTLVVSVKDSKHLAQTQDKLLGIVKVQLQDKGGLGQGPRAARADVPRIDEAPFAGQTIYSLADPSPGFPLAPCWCLTDKELIVALFPENIKAYLSRRGTEGSLAKNSAVASLLGGQFGPVALAYQDTPALFRVVYPLLQLAGHAGINQLRQEGLDISPLAMPSAPPIVRHLRPGVTAVRRTATGIELVSRQSIPGGSLAASAPLALGLALPAVQSARASARRVQSMNNLKQLALALHAYHAASRSFPPAYTTSKEGKPLLSWRVAILPYIEQQPLYEQFHKDEPWDSPHNKKLLAMMPGVFRSSRSGAAAGMTTYLGVAGPHGVFPGEKGITLAQIIDGTSNTIMLVEVPDAAAVPWTRPGDLVPDLDNPLRGLVGSWPGGFLAAFADGSVRMISYSINPKTLKALFTRDGGELIGPTDIK
jgi:hypothetical protein